MSSVHIHPPFEAFRGKEKYCFVSYSHQDSETVFLELTRLHELGINIWYDEGIDPGNEWPEEIANALAECAIFIVFISPRAVDSKNVRNEINFAINRNKPFVAIHIEETMLPAGLELRMGDTQAIMKYRMPEESYFRKVEKVLKLHFDPSPEINPFSPLAPEKKINPIPKLDFPEPEQIWFVPGVGISLLPISAGEFMMGSPPHEIGRDMDETLHRVSLSTPFWIGKYPVTQKNYEYITGKKPSRFSCLNEETPIENITWLEAVEFCRLLTLTEKNAQRIPTGYEYRLPTEAEWEYSCRAGTSTSFYFGNDETGIDDFAWHKLNSGGTPHPVGQKKPNAWGLYDMQGNVREWCYDNYSMYQQSPTTDPISLTEDKLRITRGGSWNRSPDRCRSARRNANYETKKDNSLGFRIVLAKTIN